MADQDKGGKALRFCGLVKYVRVCVAGIISYPCGLFTTFSECNVGRCKECGLLLRTCIACHTSNSLTIAISSKHFHHSSPSVFDLSFRTNPPNMANGYKLPPNAFSQHTVSSVGYASIATVSTVLFARLTLLYVHPRRLTSGEYLVLIAYVLFVAQCSLYIIIAPIQSRILNVQRGKEAYYEGLVDDALLLGRLYNPALWMFWIILWFIKGSFLMLYRQMVIRLPIVYERVWWAIVSFCIITGIGNFVAYFLSCENVKSLFDAGCHDIARQFANLWYSYAADTTTNIIIMALPIHLTWGLPMPRRKRIAIITLFTSGVACIFIATIRAAAIAANTIRTKDPVDGTWLALWGIVESAIAVIVGCCPSFAVLMNVAKRRSNKSPNNARRTVLHVDEVDLKTIGRMSACRRNNQPGLGTVDLIWSDDQSGQEAFSMDHDQAEVDQKAPTDETSSRLYSTNHQCPIQVDALQ